MGERRKLLLSSYTYVLDENREFRKVKSQRSWFLVISLLATVGCAQNDASPSSTGPIQRSTANSGANDQQSRNANQTRSEASPYTPPSDEESAPMRPGYAAELAKIHEPPEMARKPMQVRKAIAPNAIALSKALSAMGVPEKATHQQRETAIREMLKIVESAKDGDGVDRAATYGAVAMIACLNRATSQDIVGYLNHAGADSDALALRARTYLRAGDRAKALEDLERILEAGDGHVLAGGDVDPRKGSVQCGWGLTDIDALGSDPRAIVVKGLYLSAFIGYGANHRGTVKEATIRDIYVRAATLWRSPIPYVLKVKVNGFGSEHSMTGSRCIRADVRIVSVPETVHDCEVYDEETRQDIRDLTMALVIDPTYPGALYARANKYLQLAQNSYSDGKPARKLFESAIYDYDAAIAADEKPDHSAYCDRALALAAIGRYQQSASGYLQAMKIAKNGIEDSPFVYMQLAGVYMKVGKFAEASNVLTQAISNTSGSGMDSVIFGGGMKAFRKLYPEYDQLPDEILADSVRRRYQPQFPSSWNVEFSASTGAYNGKIASTILVDLFAMRGDAYMKEGRRAEALADYHRVKSDVWSGDEQYLPRHTYFKKNGTRNFELPASWPPPPPLT